jgi:hypothetical protein
MTDELADRTQDHVIDDPTRFERTFRNGTMVFRYCYADCKIMQILTAKSAFQFAQAQMQHPPRTLDELEKTGQMDQAHREGDGVERRRVPRHARIG